jgi:ribose transport system permease protein
MDRRARSLRRRFLVGGRLLRIMEWAQYNGLFFGVVVLILVFSSRSSLFLTRGNISVILLQVAVVAIIAVPSAMLLLGGFVDLSVGSVAVLAAVVFGELASGVMSTWLAFACALATAGAFGLVNGVLIAYMGLSPIVVTLGGLAGARGLAEVSNGAVTKFDFGTAFGQLGNGKELGVGTPVWIAAGVFVIGAYLWYLAPYGRHLTAIGADRAAARSIGVATKRLPCLVYVATGLAAGLAGLILTSELDSASLTIGVNLELDVLTAVLLGGVSFMGGRGSLFGVLMGVLFIGILDNGLIVININPFYQGIAVGLALVLAAALDVLYRRLERIEIKAPGELARTE